MALFEMPYEILQYLAELSSVNLRSGLRQAVYKHHGVASIVPYWLTIAKPTEASLLWIILANKDNLGWAQCKHMGLAGSTNWSVWYVVIPDTP